MVQIDPYSNLHVSFGCLYMFIFNGLVEPATIVLYAEVSHCLERYHGLEKTLNSIDRIYNAQSNI